MPIIESDFTTSFLFKNKHFSTVYRTLFSRPKTVYQRKRIFTLDTDFIDLDFSTPTNSSEIILLIHGLEGSSKSKYIHSTVDYLVSQNLNAVVYNLKGCSGEINKKLTSYHSGETADLNFVLNYLFSQLNYSKISLVGFSLGGNMALKYIAEKKENYPSYLNCVVAISAPCDLKSSSIELSKKSNRIYMKRFLKTLIQKATEKSLLFPEEKINIEAIKASQNFADFDEHFTAVINGYKNAEDYWKKESSLPLLSQIKLPTYLITAENDPFLGTACYPKEIAKKNNFFHLEITKYGGHIGFINGFSSKNNLWMEKKITKFIQKILKVS